METLKIEIPKNHEIESFDQSTGVIKFREKPKKINERIKTIADLLADHGYTQERFDQLCKDLSTDEKAYRLLKLLTLSLNEGWFPDWDNSSQPKYYAWFYMGGSSGFRFDGFDTWRSVSFVGSRLCFKTSELATHAGKHFTEVYKQFMSI
jgi:hypothetical protein